MTRFLARELATAHWFDISVARRDLASVKSRGGLVVLGEAGQDNKGRILEAWNSGFLEADKIMDEFHLESIAQLHAVNVAACIPFTIARLQERDNQTETILTVILRNIRGVTTQDQLRVVWAPASIPLLPSGVQETAVTEWAALGLASVVIWHYAGMRIQSVAAVGDRFDYWVRDGDQELGLEVSGTISESLDTRYREKVGQLRDNPFAVDGYVVVADFQTRPILFSFESFQEVNT